MIGDSHAHAKFVGEVIKLITGTSFIVIGLVVLVVAAIRRRAGGVRAVFLLGVWIAIYGIQRLNDCDIPDRSSAALDAALHPLLARSHHLPDTGGRCADFPRTHGRPAAPVRYSAGSHRSAHRRLRHRSLRVDRRGVLSPSAEQFSRRCRCGRLIDRLSGAEPQPPISRHQGSQRHAGRHHHFWRRGPLDQHPSPSRLPPRRYLG